MMIAFRALRRALLVLPMLALAACNVVGEGNKIETLQIKDGIYGYDIASPLQTFRCLRYSLAALGTFSDGTSAFYTDRATWSSSDNNVARVSNGDIFLPAPNASLVYSRGTVIPVGVGTVTITVDYVGVKASMQVTVNAAPTITLVPSSTITPRPTAPATVTIAPRTVISYTALATINGRTTDITNIGNWSVQNASPSTDAATFVTGSTSSFKGVLAGGPITLQADFNQVAGACPSTPTAQLSVAEIQSIALSSEYGASPNPVVLTTTDRLKTTASLNGGATQDISELVLLNDGTSSIVSYNLPTITSTAGATDDVSVLSYTLYNLLRALSTGTTADTNSADLTASFAKAASLTCNSRSTDPNCVVSPRFNRATQDGTLAAVTICAVSSSTPVNSCSNPASTTIKVPNFLQYGEDQARVQLRAIATFNKADGSGTVDQDVSRHVLWTSSNPGIISILNGGVSPTQAGLAGSLVAGTVTVSASYTKGTVTLSSNTLTLVAVTP